MTDSDDHPRVPTIEISDAAAAPESSTRNQQTGTMCIADARALFALGRPHQAHSARRVRLSDEHGTVLAEVLPVSLSERSNTAMRSARIRTRPR